MHVVVAYDISKDQSRKKVADLLTGVLTRVQNIVFEGEVPRTLLRQVVRSALGFVDSETDSLRVYYLCAACASKVDSYGRSTPAIAEEVRIL